MVRGARGEMVNPKKETLTSVNQARYITNPRFTKP